MNFLPAGHLARCFRFLRASCALTMIAAAWLMAGANLAHAQSRAYIHSISPAVVEEGQTVTITIQFDGTPRTDDSLVTIQFAGDAAAPTPDINRRGEDQYRMRYGGGATFAALGSSQLLDSQSRGVFRVPANDDSVTVHLDIRNDLARETTQTIAFALVAHTDSGRDPSGRDVESFVQSVEIAANRGESRAFLVRLGDDEGSGFPVAERGFHNSNDRDFGAFRFRLRLEGEQRVADSIVLVQLGGDAVTDGDFGTDFTYELGGDVISGTLTTDNIARIRMPAELPDQGRVEAKFPIPQDGVAENTQTITYQIVGHTNLDESTDGTDEYALTFDGASYDQEVRASEMITFAQFVNPPAFIQEGASATVAIEFIGTPRPGTETFVTLSFGGIDSDDISIGYDDTARERVAFDATGNLQLGVLSNGTSRANIIITAVADADNDYENIDIRITNYGISEGGLGVMTSTGHRVAPDLILIPIVPDHFSTTLSKIEIIERGRTSTVHEGSSFHLSLRFTGAVRPNHSRIRWQTGGDAVIGVVERGARVPHDYDYFITPPISAGIDAEARTDSAALSLREHYHSMTINVRADDFAESTETFTIALSEHTDLGGNSAGRIVDTATYTFIIPANSGNLHFPQDDTRIAFGVGAQRLYAVLNQPAQIRERDIGLNTYHDVPDSDTVLANGCFTPSFFIPQEQVGTCAGFRIGVGPDFRGPVIPIESVRLESIGGGTPSAASTGVVVLELARPVRTGEERLWLRYGEMLVRSSWNGRRPGDREGYVHNREAVPAALGEIPRVMMLYDEFKDSDGDGVSDAAEAVRFGTNPHINTVGRPQVSLERGTGGNTAFVASGRLTDSERLSHLGVTVTGASTVRAYYLSDTFGYAGGYVNVSESYGCDGRFPANYDAPLIVGGCALVDFENILPNVEHTIGWFAANNEGWATADNTASGLPEQRIQRIPRVNMAPARNFVRREATEIFVRAVAEAPVPEPAVHLAILLPDGSATTLEVDAERRSYASTLTRTPGNQAVDNYRIDPAETRAYDSGDPGNTGFPGATSYEIGPVNEMAVYFLEGVAPSLGRPALTKDDDSEERTLVEEGGTNYKVTIPVLYAGGVIAGSEHLANIREIGLADEAGERVITARFDVPAGFAGTTGTSVSLIVTASAIARGDYATTQTATVTLSWPVVPMLAAGGSRMVADLMGDNDGDSIPNEQDPYPDIAGLPVMVSSGTGMTVNPQDHIRPVLPVHELSAGDRTRARASSQTLADEDDLDDMGYMDDYEKYSASEADVRLPASVDDTPFEVTYDFDISGVAPSVDTSTTARATTATVTGGRAGVIIPLPQMLSGTTSLFLYKYRGADSTQTEAFTVDDEPGGNEFGFAPADENGVCPTDDGTAASPYRDADGNLERAKAVGDLCVVLYIVDGGPNDEDGEMNGIIKDPVGTSEAMRRDTVVGTAQGIGGGGGGATGAITGGSGSFGLAGVGVLLLLTLLALFTPLAPQGRRGARRARQRAY